MSNESYETAVRYELNRFKEAVETLIEERVKADFEKRYKDYTDGINSISDQIDYAAANTEELSGELKAISDSIDALNNPWD